MCWKKLRKPRTATNNPCHWFGVTCNDNGQVTALQLPHHGLSGTVPPTLNGLAALEVLELQDNPALSGISALRMLPPTLRVLDLRATGVRVSEEGLLPGGAEANNSTSM